MATEFVRVKDPDTGHEVTVPKRFADGHKLEPIDKPATNADGRPLPAKPHVTVKPVKPGKPSGTSGQTAGEAGI